MSRLEDQWSLLNGTEISAAIALLEVASGFTSPPGIASANIGSHHG